MKVMNTYRRGSWTKLKPLLMKFLKLLPHQNEDMRAAFLLIGYYIYIIWLIIQVNSYSVYLSPLLSHWNICIFFNISEQYICARTHDICSWPYTCNLYGIIYVQSVGVLRFSAFPFVSMNMIILGLFCFWAADRGQRDLVVLCVAFCYWS